MKFFRGCIRVRQNFMKILKKEQTLRMLEFIVTKSEKDCIRERQRRQ